MYGQAFARGHAAVQEHVAAYEHEREHEHEHMYEQEPVYEHAAVRGQAGVVVPGEAAVLGGRRTGRGVGRWTRPPVRGRTRLAVPRGTRPAAVAIFMAAL